MVFYLIVRIYPTLEAFWLSFTVADDSTPTLANYIRLVQDPTFWQAVLNTFLYAVITVPLEMGLGLLIALAIERVTAGRGLYRLMFFLPYMTSIVAVSWVWRLIYDPNSGALNGLLSLVHIPPQGWLNDPNEALVSVSILMIWQMMGFTMLIFSAGLQAIPPQYYEAAGLDGASRWQAFWSITLPLLNPTVVFLAIIGVIQTLQTFTQIANLTGGNVLGGPLNSTSSMVIYMYREGFLNYDMNFASASTVFLFVVVLAVTLIQFKVLNKSYQL